MWRICCKTVRIHFRQSCTRTCWTALSSCSVRRGIARCFRRTISRACISCSGRRGWIFGAVTVRHSWRSLAARRRSAPTTDLCTSVTGSQRGRRICGGRQNVSRSTSSCTSRTIAHPRCIRVHLPRRMRMSFVRPSNSSMKSRVKFRRDANSSLKTSGGRG